MAALALGLVATGVNILDLVASVTALGRALVVFVIMALGTRHLLVRAFERIRGLIVVEGRNFNPALFRMTAFAVLTQRAVMTIGVLVAADALRRRLGVFFSLGMTRGALQTYVPIQQRILSVSVREEILIKAGDIGAPPLVICMTDFAFRLMDLSEFAMIPAVVPQVRRDVFMAGSTQTALCLPRHRRMTTVAGFLIFGVCLGEITGRNHLLENILRLELRRHSEVDSEDQEPDPDLRFHDVCNQYSSTAMMCRMTVRNSKTRSGMWSRCQVPSSHS